MRFIASRLLQSLLSLLGTITIVFVVLHFAGNPAAIIAGPNATQHQIHLIELQLGLNKPLYVQYLGYLWKLIHGNFGYSYTQYQPAIRVIFEHLVYTVDLAVAGFVISFVLGIAMGVAMARYGGFIERTLMLVVTGGQSIPSFWLGLMLILLFSVGLHWLPSSGAGSPMAVVLPALTIASFLLPGIARITWQSVLDELPKDYVRTAYAKGLKANTVWFKHLLRNAAIPIITMGALQFAALMGGAVLTEVVFAWPGVGRLMVQSVESLDLPVVEAITILASAAYIGANFVADVLYMVSDPKVQVGGVQRG